MPRLVSNDFINKYPLSCLKAISFVCNSLRPDSNYFAFSEDSIDKIIRHDMIDEYNKDKYNYLPRESDELHPTFQVDGVRFTLKAYDKRKPGLFKVETQKDKMISLCSKMYCCADTTEKEFKFSCKGIQKAGNDICYKKFHDVLFENKKDIVNNTGFRYINGTMKTYEQQKKGLSYAYHKRIVHSDGISTSPLNI